MYTHTDQSNEWNWKPSQRIQVSLSYPYFIWLFWTSGGYFDELFIPWSVQYDWSGGSTGNWGVGLFHTRRRLLTLPRVTYLGSLSCLEVDARFNDHPSVVYLSSYFLFCYLERKYMKSYLPQDEPESHHRSPNVRETWCRHQRLDRWNFLHSLEENAEGKERWGMMGITNNNKILLYRTPKPWGEGGRLSWVSV